MTDWTAVERTLRARGLWNEDGISRKARARRCKACGAAVFAGLDADRGGMVALCNPTPLSALGEAMAQLSGRRTYSLAWMGRHYEIDFRDADRIKGTPAGSRQFLDVVAAHECGEQLAPQYVAHSALLDLTQKELPENAPF